MAKTDNFGNSGVEAPGSGECHHSGQRLNSLFRIFAYSVLSGLLLSGDWFGLSWKFARQSENIVLSFLSPFYGKGLFVARSPKARPAGPDDEQEPPARWNEHITVLQIDDRFLKENNLSWPVSRGIHARILEDLHENFTPDVIFVDILFMDDWAGDRVGLDELARVLREIAAAGKTKLFLASFGDGPGEGRILPRLSASAEPAVVQWPTGSHVSRSSLYYPLADRAGDAGSPDSASAAFMIYRHLCEKTLKCREDMNDFDQDYRRPMQVFWGIDPLDLNWEQSNRFAVPCHDLGTSFWGRAVDLLIGGFRGEEDSALQTCPYAQLIKARDFYLEDKNACDVAAAGARNTVSKKPFRCHADVQEAYKKAMGREPQVGPKIVLYSVDVTGARDVVETPTHGPVDGVFLHAMALDNLLTMGDGYLRSCGLRRLSWLDALFSSDSDELPRCEVVGGMTAISTILSIAVVVISVLLTDLRGVAVTGGVSRRGLAKLVGRLLDLPFGPTLWWIVRITIIPVFLLAAVVYLFLFERQAPANWVSIFGIAAIISYIDQKYVERRVSQLIGLIYRRE